MGFTFEEAQPPTLPRTLMLIGQVTSMIENPLQHTYAFLVLIPFLGVQKNNGLSHDHQLKLNIEHLQTLHQKHYGS